MPVQNALNKNDDKWDVGKSIAIVDGIQCSHYIPNEEHYTENPITARSNSSADDNGNGVTLIKHVKDWQVTVNITAFDPLWQRIMEDPDGFVHSEHTIDTMNQMEHLHSTTASIENLPNINAGNSTPNRALTFKCIRADLSKSNNN